MDPEIPGLGTYMAEGYGGGNAPASYTPPPRESEAMPGSQSQVPGTSGAPAPAHRARLWALSLVASPAVAALGLSILDY